jgi:hypothetical protein
MMGRVDRQAGGTERRRGATPGLKPHPMAPRVPGTVGPVFHCAGPLGRKILVERAPERDVDELDASTDAQDRQLTLPGHGEKRQFE